MVNGSLGLKPNYEYGHISCVRGLRNIEKAFTLLTGGIVIDGKNNLMWQDNSEVLENDRTWQEATQYCESLSLLDHDNWRLPNINELLSIIDENNEQSGLLDVFQNKPAKNYPYLWSSTNTASNNGHSWLFKFLYW